MSEIKENSESFENKPKKSVNGKYRYVKSVIGQYIKGQIRAADVFKKSSIKDSQNDSVNDVIITEESMIFQTVSNTPTTCSSKNSKPINSKVEMCAPNILCLNFNQKSGDTENFSSSAHYATDKKTLLLLELRELKRISTQNETQINKLAQKLNELKLSISLLNEEQQRLEHSREIRTIGLKLLNNMLKGKYDDEKETNEKREQFEKEKLIIEKILEQLARLEKVKMKLEYENVRSLHTIKELKRENNELERIKSDLRKELNDLA